MVTDGPPKDRIAGLECVQDRVPGRRAFQLQLDLALHAGQGAKVLGDDDTYHDKVWTSTDRTGGRWLTMGVHPSPESEEAKTWPPVVPK